MKIDAIGDLFIWLSSGILSVSKYSKKFAGETVVVVRPELAELIRDHGLFDTVWTIDPVFFKTNIWYRLCVLIRFRRYGFSCVLQMRTAREFLLEDALTRVTGAEDRFSPIGDIYNMRRSEAKLGDSWYTRTVAIDPHGQELDRNSSVIQALMGAPPERYDLKIGDTKLPPGVDRSYYIISPGAGWAPRRWPSENFADLASRIRGLQCVVVGTSVDFEAAEKIAETSKGLNLCGKLNLLELISLVRDSAFVIANESGVAHIAAYVGIPCVAIVGGGHFGWFIPYPKATSLLAPVCVSQAMECFNCNWQCKYEISFGRPVPCIENVSVDEVWGKTSALLLAREG